MSVSGQSPIHARDSPAITLRIEVSLSVILNDIIISTVHYLHALHTIPSFGLASLQRRMQCRLFRALRLA